MPRKTKESENKLDILKNLLSRGKDKKEKKAKTSVKTSNLKDNKISVSSKKDETAPKKTSSKTSKKEKSSSSPKIKEEKKSDIPKEKEEEKSINKTAASKNSTSKKQSSKKDEEKKGKTKTTAKKTSDVSKTKSTANSKKSTKETSQSTKKASSATKTAKAKNTLKSFSPEYYDLPYKYNKTVVKILAQTPTNLFVYWEISDEDRENLKQKYGQYFFEITKPVLIIHNETLNYSFEIDINDFANSWYFEVNDSDCEYKIELGRRPIPVNYSYMPQYDIAKNGPIAPLQTKYIYISSSNEIESPNNHILFNNRNKIYFRNVKTNQIIERDITDFPFIVKDNKFINIYELYEQLYKEEILHDSFNLRNPSSGNLSSSNLSSW